MPFLVVQARAARLLLAVALAVGVSAGCARAAGPMNRAAAMPFRPACRSPIAPGGAVDLGAILDEWVGA